MGILERKIIQAVKTIALRFIYGYATSEDYTRWLRDKGVIIGKGTKFYSPHHINIDVTRPYAIRIGNNVHITRNVTILTHGFDGSVIKGKYNDVIGSFGEVVIGDNVFIGTGATIQKCVNIGDNIIIGAESVVTKDCLESGVYVGVPARFLCSIEEYYKKRIELQEDEAKALVRSYYKRYAKIPPKVELDEFFYLFEDRSLDLCDAYVYQMNNNGCYEECFELFKSGHRQKYKNYEEFVKECLKNYEQ